MKKHALGGRLLEAAAHYDSVIGPGRDFQTSRNAGGIDLQGVVTGRAKRARDAGQHALAIMEDRVGFAMDRLAGRADASPAGRSDHLHTQADAEDGDSSGKPAHHIGAHAGAFGPEWSRREDDAIGPARHNLFQSNGIGPHDFTMRAQGFRGLHQVPCERIVVVQNQGRHKFQCSGGSRCGAANPGRGPALLRAQPPEKAIRKAAASRIAPHYGLAICAGKQKLSRMTMDKTLNRPASQCSNWSAEGSGLTAGFPVGRPKAYKPVPVTTYKTPFATIGMLITLENNHLFSKLGNQQAIAIFPESKTMFFPKVVNAELEFTQHDDRGRPTELILHQNGRDMVLKAAG